MKNKYMLPCDAFDRKYDKVVSINDIKDTLKGKKSLKIIDVTINEPKNLSKKVNIDADSEVK